MSTSSSRTTRPKPASTRQLPREDGSWPGALRIVGSLIDPEDKKWTWWRGPPLLLCPLDHQIYADSVLDLSKLDVDEIASALSDHSDYEHMWLIDPRTGETAFWTADTGIDGQNPVDVDELDLIPIEPLPSYVWYQDMADFAEGVSDDGVRRRLARALDGKGAFRRFRLELYEEYPELVASWHAFRDARAKRRAVEWLSEEKLIDRAVLAQFLVDNPDPDVP